MRTFGSIVKGTMYNAGPIYAFLADALERGKKTALVTIVAVAGASSRKPGMHIAVAEDRNFAGSLSGRCIAAAVITEAVQLILTVAVTEVRFGAGSPFTDIRLPAAVQSICFSAQLR